jgi:multiple sugar transport system substrate-binding protein
VQSRSRRGVQFAVAALLTFLSASMLIACGSDSGSGPTKLSFFIFNEPSGAFVKAADSCTKQSKGEYEISFEYLPADADGQREQLVRRLGAEDSSIDIIGMDVIWTAEFANAGWIQEWQEPEKSKVTKNVFDSVVTSATFDGKLYAAPFTSNTQLLWYRKDRVEKVPKTWEEMLSEAEKIGSDGLIQVQANRYEGFVVWVNSMIESAGAHFLDGPEKVSLAEKPTEDALKVMSEYANSPAAPSDLDTSTEDTSRLSFESGSSSFMLNYPFVYPSAKENAPDVFKQMGAALYPEVIAGKPSKPPLGGINLGISTYSEHSKEAFDAAACLVQPANQITAAQLGGLPPTNSTLYARKPIKDAYPGFSGLLKQSIDNAAPRPQTPAYTDLSLGIQRALHPIGSTVDPDDPTDGYDKLRDYVDQAVKREGLL